MRRQIATALFVLLGIITSQPAARAQDRQADRDEVLSRWVGSFTTTVQQKPTDALPDGANRTNQEHATWVLKDRFVFGRQITEGDGAKAMWFITRDRDADTFRYWFFSKDVRGGQWAGTWDAAMAQMTMEATDTPAGWTSKLTHSFPDKATSRITGWMKNDSGKTVFDMTAKKSRADARTGEKTLAAWAKDSRAEEALSNEMAVLQRLIGEWDVTAVSKPAEWTPQEVQTTSKVERTWILDRSYVLDVSRVSDGKEGMSLLTYDARSKAYRSWWFSSEGYTSQSSGRWDAATRTMELSAELEGGLNSRTTARFADDDHHEWRVEVKDGDGKVYFDTTWTCVRKKK